MSIGSLRSFVVSMYSSITAAMPETMAEKMKTTGISETDRVLTFLASQTAGQCGPCVQGLPLLADGCRALAAGTLRRRGLRRLLSLADVVDGGGACRHPDGAVRLIRSALDGFADDVAGHLRGEACSGAQRPPVFPLPEVDPSDRVWR